MSNVSKGDISSSILSFVDLRSKIYADDRSLYRNLLFTMSSFKVDQTFNIPTFDGSNWDKFEKELYKVFILLGLTGIFDGTTASGTTAPVPEPTMPAPFQRQPLPTSGTETADQLAARKALDKENFDGWYRDNEVYKAQHAQWLAAETFRMTIIREYRKQNSQALAVINRAIPDGVWNTVKQLRDAKQVFNQLKADYGKTPYAKIMDHFNQLKNWRTDLSNPVPQLAEFTHIFYELPATFLADHLAAAILLQSLPLKTPDVSVESAYRQVYQTWITTKGDPSTWTLADMKTSIIECWNGKFLSTPEKDCPKKGTNYFNYDKKGQQANRSSGIRNKGNNPRHNDQQQPSSQAPATPGQEEDNKNRRRRQRQRGRGGKNGTATTATTHPVPAPVQPDVQFSLPALLSRTPPPPPPS